MNVITAVVLTLLSFTPTFSPQWQVGQRNFGPTVLPPPSFVTYTYLPDNAATMGSITTSPITVTSGQFFVVLCRYGIATTATVTSSISTGTIAAGAASNYSLGSIQASAGKITATGSATFTCTFNTTASYTSMIVLIYANAPNTVTIQTSVPNTGSSPPISVTGITTTTQTLIVLCGTSYSAGLAWTAGSIGGTTATLRGFSAASNGGDAACEDLLTTTAQTGISGSMGFSPNNAWAGTVVAIPY